LNYCVQCDKPYDPIYEDTYRMFSEHFCNEECRVQFFIDEMDSGRLPPASDAIH